MGNMCTKPDDSTVDISKATMKKDKKNQEMPVSSIDNETSAA